MKKTLMVVLLVVVCAGYVGYQRLTNQEQGIQLVTARVTRGDVVRGIDATGRLEAVMTVQVGSQVSGTIKELNADSEGPVPVEVKQRRDSLVPNPVVRSVRLQLEDCRGRRLRRRRARPAADGRAVRRLIEERGLKVE